MSAFVEAAYDEREDAALGRLLEALTWLAEQLRSRAGQENGRNGLATIQSPMKLVRFVVDEYQEGGRYAVATTQNGAEGVEWVGPLKPGKRLAAFLVAVFDDEVEDGFQRLLEAIDWLRAEIEKRKGAPVAV
jgi:hypothetical protein